MWSVHGDDDGATAGCFFAGSVLQGKGHKVSRGGGYAIEISRKILRGEMQSSRRHPSQEGEGSSPHEARPSQKEGFEKSNSRTKHYEIDLQPGKGTEIGSFTCDNFYSLENIS